MGRNIYRVIWLFLVGYFSWVLSTVEARISYDVGNSSHESRLVNGLLERYASLGPRPIIRPRKNSSELVEVQVGLRLITLDVDEKHQVLTTSMWVRLKWYDDYLHWDPDDYGGLKHVILPYKSVWMPEHVTLVNTAESERDELLVDLQVKYNGQVFYAPHRVFKSGCLIDVTNYPFDTQTCDLWIQSATRYSFLMDLQPYYKTPMDLSTYMSSFKESAEWDVVANTSSRYDKPKSDGVQLMYSKRVSLKFSLTLKRRFGFKGVLLMLPCVFLSFLAGVVFCLPPERPDRHMLGMSLFASLVVMLLILIENAPPSAASIPKLGIYYFFNMFMIILALFFSVIIVNVARRGEDGTKPPVWLRKIFAKVLSPIVFAKSKKALLLGPPTMKTETRDDGNTLVALNTPQAKSIDEGCSYKPSIFDQSDNTYGDENTTCLCCRRRNVTRKEKHDDKRELVQNGVGMVGLARRQWRAIAHIMDRLCAMLFFLVNVIALIMLYPKPT